MRSVSATCAGDACNHRRYAKRSATLRSCACRRRNHSAASRHSMSVAGLPPDDVQCVALTDERSILAARGDQPGEGFGVGGIEYAADMQGRDLRILDAQLQAIAAIELLDRLADRRALQDQRAIRPGQRVRRVHLLDL